MPDVEASNGRVTLAIIQSDIKAIGTKLDDLVIEQREVNAKVNGVQLEHATCKAHMEGAVENVQGDLKDVKYDVKGMKSKSNAWDIVNSAAVAIATVLGISK